MSDTNSAYVLAFCTSLSFPRYKGKLGACDLDSVNEAGLSILRSDFGLTNISNTIYYEFVKGGAARSFAPCDSNDVNGLAQYTVQPALDPKDQVRWTRQNCTDYGGVWRNELPNFDNFGNSFIALFHLATTEGWVDLMHRCINAVGKDQHPMQGFSPSRAIAFVLYILVVAIFLTQLFATALVANFERLSQRESGLLSLTLTQQEWLATTHALSTVDFHRRVKAPPENAAGSRVRRKLFMAARSKTFKVCTLVMVVLYLFMCIVEAVIPDDPDSLLLCTYIEVIAVMYFVLEMVIKLGGFGRGYLIRWEQKFGFTPPAENVNHRPDFQASARHSSSDSNFVEKIGATTPDLERPAPRSDLSFDPKFDVDAENNSFENTTLRGFGVDTKTNLKHEPTIGGLAPIAEEKTLSTNSPSGLKQNPVAEDDAQLAKQREYNRRRFRKGPEKRMVAGPGQQFLCFACRPRRRRILHSMNLMDLLGILFCIVSLVLDLVIYLRQSDPSFVRPAPMHDTLNGADAVALVFRVLRLFRIVTLLRSTPTIRRCGSIVVVTLLAVASLVPGKDYPTHCDFIDPCFARYLVTLGHSVVAVANIFVLFFVLINTFALIMREFFHFVELRPENVGGLEPHAHFQGWFDSFSVMARSTTGEAWHKIVYDLARFVHCHMACAFN